MIISPECHVDLVECCGRRVPHALFWMDPHGEQSLHDDFHGVLRVLLDRPLEKLSQETSRCLRV